jgi:glycosyltransferase involved in cell wall biosynthesis
VEDNSPDKTQEIVEEMQKFYGERKIKMLKRKGKLGLGSAYADGSKLCAGDFIFIMDADFSHHVCKKKYLQKKLFFLAKIFDKLHQVWREKIYFIIF